MAMNGAQLNGWSAGTGSSLTPSQLNILILGTFRQFTELAVRLLVLYLATLFLFFH